MELISKSRFSQIRILTFHYFKEGIKVSRTIKSYKEIKNHPIKTTGEIASVGKNAMKNQNSIEGLSLSLNKAFILIRYNIYRFQR